MLWYLVNLALPVQYPCPCPFRTLSWAADGTVPDKDTGWESHDARSCLELTYWEGWECTNTNSSAHPLQLASPPSDGKMWRWPSIHSHDEMGCMDGTSLRTGIPKAGAGGVHALNELPGDIISSLHSGAAG